MQLESFDWLINCGVYFLICLFYLLAYLFAYLFIYINIYLVSYLSRYLFCFSHLLLGKTIAIGKVLKLLS